MNISKIMTKKVVTVNVTTPIGKAISTMEAKGIKELPVLVGGKYKGLLIYYQIADKIKSNNEKAENFVKSAPVLSQKDTIEKAIDLMLKSGITGLPVIEDKKVVGIVSDFDILRLLINNHVFDNLKVLDVLVKRFPVLRQEDSIELAIQLASENNLDSLPVIDNFGKTVGEVFLSDMLTYLLKQRLGNKSGKRDLQRREQKEENVMRIISREMPQILSTLNLRRALEIMLLSRMKATVVSDAENKPVGILSRLKVLSLLSGSYAEEQISVSLSGDYDLDTSLLARSRILKHENLLIQNAGIKGVSIYIKKIKGQDSHRYEISLTAFGNKNYVMKNVGINRDETLSDLIDNLIETIERSKD